MISDERFRELEAACHDAAFRFVFLMKNILRETAGALAERKENEEKDGAEFWRKEAGLWRGRWQQLRVELMKVKREVEEREADEREKRTGVRRVRRRRHK
jgi:hypothetical protein